MKNNNNNIEVKVSPRQQNANTETLIIRFPKYFNLNNYYKTFLLALSSIPGLTISYYGCSVVAKFCPSTACQAGFSPAYLIAYLVLGGFYSRANIQLLRNLPIIFKGKKTSLKNLLKISILLPLILSGICIGYLHLDVGEKLSLPKALYWPSAIITTLMTGLANYIPTFSLYDSIKSLFLDFKAIRYDSSFLLDHHETDAPSQKRDALKIFLTRINLNMLRSTPIEATQILQSLLGTNEETSLKNYNKLFDLGCRPINISQIIKKDLPGILTFITAICGNYIYFQTGLKAGSQFTNNKGISNIIGAIAGVVTMLVRSALAFSAVNRLSTHDRRRTRVSIIGFLGALSLSFCQAGMVLSYTDSWVEKGLSFFGLMLGGLGITIAGIVNLLETKDLLPCVNSPLIKPSDHNLLAQRINRLMEICDGDDEESINNLFTYCLQITRDANNEALRAADSPDSSQSPTQLSAREEQKLALPSLGIDAGPRHTFCDSVSTFFRSLRYIRYRNNAPVQPLPFSSQQNQTPSIQTPSTIHTS